MEYKKTKSLLTIALLFGVIFSFALVSAQDDTVVIDTSHYNVWDNFLYKLSKTIGLFTAAGQARTCATYATLTIDPASSGTYYPQQLLTQSGWTGPSALINVFDSEWHFLGEYKSEINQAINLQGDVLPTLIVFQMDMVILVIMLMVLVIMMKMLQTIQQMFILVQMEIGFYHLL